jgi:electron transport complex protein RnfE
MVKNVIPSKIRIPAYIVIIASFVTMVDLTMHAFLTPLHKSLGLFIPLIVVNCIILGRAEAFASKNNVLKSILDGLGMGLGFTLALMVIASIREILGAGQFFGMQVLPASYKPMLVAILAPGAFIVMGLLMGLMNIMKNKKK